MNHENLSNVITQSMSGSLLLYWDAKEGLCVVNDNSNLSLEGSLPKGFEALADMVMPEDGELFQTFVNRLKQGMKGQEDFLEISEDRVDVAVRMRKKDGNYAYHNVIAYLVKDTDGALFRMTIVVQELTNEEIYRIGLAKIITNDKNPEMFNKISYELLHKNPEKKFAVIQFDVAKFKAINEMYGEAFGDEVLEFFVESLKVICSSEQLFVRLTADVFMILTSYETKQDLLDLIELVNNSLSGYKGAAYRLVFGVNYVENIEERLRKYGDGAAVARQSIKQNALKNIAFYEEGMKNPILTSKYLEDHMEQALRKREFMMYLQPKYCIGTNEVIGAEALVRWNSKERGIVPPMEFIPLFEKNGFVTKVDAYIWEEACKLIRKQLDENGRCVPISVNMSRIHLKEEKYLETLENLIKKYQIPKEYLEIEITESADEDEVYEGITKLKEHGYILLMDDFGSGYSSLNTLKDTQFDTIKIDRIFFQNFIESQRGKNIVKYVIQMTQSIGLDIIAEGVETKEQAEFLLTCGCNVAQGFYYAKPMPAEDFEKLL